MKSGFGSGERVARFGSIFLGVLVLTLCHRYFSLTEFATNSYAWTYNAYDGFDPVTAFLNEKAPVLWLGVASDILFSAAFAIVFAFAPNLLLVVSVIALTFFYAANIEHIKANLSAVDLDLMGFATDATFIEAHLTWDVVYFTVVYSALGLALMRIKRIKALAVTCAVAALIVCGAALAYIPNSFRITEPAWLQKHPLLPKLGQTKLEFSSREFEKSAFDRDRQAEFGADRLNVLMIYLEGLSHFSLAKAEMNVLNDLAASNIQFERFIGHQLITSNGLYTTLTGDLPSFITSESKWNALSAGSDVTKDALPSVLARNGYHTAFLQSAPLTFMSKDQHLKELGFEELRGDSDWGPGLEVFRNGWGIDDRSLFRNIVDYIDNLDDTQPWFISALTTGTHAPYNVPDDFLPNEASARYRALKFVDAAIEELMQNLDDRGLLDNTVIILTSDESRESSNLPTLDNEVLLNWLPLVAIHPSRKSASLSQIVSSKYIRSIVLNLATNTEAPDLSSLPDGNTPVIFGNVFSGRIFWYDPRTLEMFACLRDANFGCEHWKDVKDLTRPTHGTKVGQAYFPGLRDAILRYSE